MERPLLEALLQDLAGVRRDPSGGAQAPVLPEDDVEPRTDGADALETLRLALAADQSARSAGQTIRLEAGAGS